MHTVALEGERCLSNNIAKAEDQKKEQNSRKLLAMSDAK